MLTKVSSYDDGNKFKYNLSNFITKLNKDKKHWCIVYKPAMRGNTLLRILASHQESWWDNTLMNINTDKLLTDPLQFSENQSSFIDVNGRFSATYLAPHTNMSVDYFCIHDWDNDSSSLKLAIQERQMNLDKYFFTCCHPVKNMKIDRYIHAYASRQNSKRKYIETKIHSSESVINIDISKLFSYSRDDFEDEYVKIINEFDFTPRFNSVRNFVLQLLDRESSWKKFAPVFSNNFVKSALFEAK